MDTDSIISCLLEIEQYFLKRAKQKTDPVDAGTAEDYAYTVRMIAEEIAKNDLNSEDILKVCGATGLPCCACEPCCSNRIEKHKGVRKWTKELFN